MFRYVRLYSKLSGSNVGRELKRTSNAWDSCAQDRRSTFRNGSVWKHNASLVQPHAVWTCFKLQPVTVYGLSYMQPAAAVEPFDAHVQRWASLLGFIVHAVSKGVNSWKIRRVPFSWEAFLLIVCRPKKLESTAAREWKQVEN